MTSVIFTGGQVFADSLAELSDEPLGCGAERLIVAADSGYNTAKRLGVCPDLLVGDLDSLDRSRMAPDELEGLEKLIVPSIKDDTDTQLAVDTVIARGAGRILIVGGLGGRLDHTLSTLFLLEYLADRGIEAVITDGRNRVRLLRAESEPIEMIVERGFKYLSLVSISDFCEGVSISGVFYPLCGVRLERSYAYAVSNEITAERAVIGLGRGSLLVIESRD